MEFSGLGTTAVFVLAAVVWLAYLVPVWTRKREYLATERNAVRLQQTLRIMAETAETPEPVRVRADARVVAQQQRAMQKEQRLRNAIERAEAVAKARELDEQIKAVEREVRAAVAGSLSRRARLRRTRLACVAMLALSVTAGVVGLVVPGMAPLLALAGIVFALAAVGLVAVNASAATLRRAVLEPVAARDSVARAAAPVTPSHPLPQEAREVQESRSWTPVPVPQQRARPQQLASHHRTASLRLTAQRRDPLDALRAAARRAAEAAPAPEPVDERLATVTHLQPATFEEVVTGEHDRVVEEALGAVRDAARHEAALPAQAAAPSPYAAMGVVDEEGVGFDVREAFRRRVG